MFFFCSNSSKESNNKWIYLIIKSRFTYFKLKCFVEVKLLKEITEVLFNRWVKSETILVMLTKHCKIYYIAMYLNIEVYYICKYSSIVHIYQVVTWEVKEEKHKSMHLLSIETLTFNSHCYYNLQGNDLILHKLTYSFDKIPIRLNWYEYLYDWIDVVKTSTIS